MTAAAPSLRNLKDGRAPDAEPARHASMSITDRRQAHHASATAFVEEIVEAVNAWWRDRGEAGCTISAVAFDELEILTLETRPGPAAISLEDVRAALPRKDAA